MQFGDICNFKTAISNSQHKILCLLEPAPVSVIDRWRPDGAAEAEC